MGKGIEVNALVNTLNLYRPDQLDALRQRYPDQSESLTPGKKLGESNNTGVAVAELAIYTLQAITEDANNGLRSLHLRLKRAAKIRLMSNIVGAVTSAGLISAVLVESKGVAIATALINLVSSVSLLISEYLESPSSGEQNRRQDLNQLIKAVVDIEMLEFKLTIGIQTKANDEELLKLAQEANAVVALVRGILMNIGKLSPKRSLTSRGRGRSQNSR
ncbi:hypothetical protein [Argonema antarcticum]|uniref:hypothetical protein n=1 Tax=Argonema antarcticum TaxID=2942763 RepID=UPI0020136E58|nr:hypothetical protein [Argonema antarcticum]MCL1471625.1 hypothetical protein [Argonema antarcticum A004/B2]